MSRFAVNQSSNADNLSTTGTQVPSIGELLVAAKIIKPEVLNDSLQIAKTSKTFIGRILISVGQLDEQKLLAVLDIQTLIRNRALNTQFGVKALSIACTSRISATEALQKLGWRVPDKPDTQGNPFAQLMIDSGLVNAHTLAVAEQQSHENNLPLGRCLVISRHMTQNRLEAILIAQSLVRDNQLTKEQALKALKLSSANEEPLERSLIKFGIQQLGESDKRILDILCMASFITETSKLTVLETSLVTERPCKEILVESGMVTNDLVEKASTLQIQILTGNLTLKQAAIFLKKSQTEELDLQVLIQQLQTKNRVANQIEQLLDLLKSTGLLTQESIDTADKLAKLSNEDIGDVLLSQQDINVTHIEAAWQAQRMIDDKMISFEYACTALRKLSGKSQLNVRENFQQSLSDTTPIIQPLPESWLSKLTKKLFKK